MQILTYLLLPFCAVLGGALQIDKNLQYNCYYQILKQYSTKSSYEYEDYSDYSHRLDDQLHLSVNQKNNFMLRKHNRREILSGVSENTQNDFTKIFTNPAEFEKGFNEDFNHNAKSVFSDNVRAKEPKYFIVASKIIRPGFIYKASATVVQSEYPIKIYANISCDGVHLTGDCKDVQEGTTETLLLRIPNQKVPKKECKLRLEGFYLNVFCDLALLHEKQLDYSQSVMKILIQTDKSLYMQGDTVRFRIFTLNMDLKGIDSVVEIYITDPKQYITRHWLKRLSNSGNLMLEYQLPEEPSFGDWTINVVLVEEGLQDKIQFTVEEYYPTHVEINVNMPEVFFTTDSVLKGHVEAKFISGEYVKGNLTLEAIIRPLNLLDYKEINQKFRSRTIEKISSEDIETAALHSKPNTSTNDFLNYTADYVFKSAYYSDDNNTNYEHSLPRIVNQLNGTFNFEWSIEEFEFLQPNMNGFELFVTATVSENIFDEVHAGYAIARIYKPKVCLSFIGGSPQVFKPTMQFTVRVVAELIDKSPLDQYLLKAGLLEISGVIETDFGVHHSWPTQRLHMLRHQTGIWELKIDLRNDLSSAELPHFRDIINSVTQLKLRAEFLSDSVDSTSSELLLVSHYSPRNQYIKVTTSTEYPTVGEYIIFHISTNFFLENFNYMVLSKDIILVNDHEIFADGMRTIALVASAEMAPIATIVVWSVTWQGQIVADALTFPVDGIFRSNLSLNITRLWNGEDFKKIIDVTIFGVPGSYVGLSAIDKKLYYLNLRNDLRNSMDALTHKMSSNRIYKHVWHLHEFPYEVSSYYPTSTNGIDAHKIFDLSELLVLTDGNVPRRSENCNSSIGFEQCLSKGCFLSIKKCDGVIDCADGSDESDCQVQNDIDKIAFTKYRSNRVLRHYQNNLFWNDAEIGPNGKYELYMNDSSSPTSWIISGFSSNFAKGIGVLPKPVEYSNPPKFFINLEMPSQCRKGEHLGIRVVISNLHFKAVLATVKLIDSKDYAFVETNNTDFIQLYLQRKSLIYHQLEQQKQEKQHMFTLQLEAQSTSVVYVPIMPITLGEINVRIRVKTSLGTTNMNRLLKVENPELKLQRHLSLILDLTKQKYLEYTNVTTIPQITKFNRVHISAASDVVGPIFETLPSSSYVQDISSFMETAEENVYDFAINLNKLKYLRLLTQRNMTAEKELYYKLNGIYQRLLSFLRADGSFSNLRSDLNFNSSVWLTAQCLRLFQEAASLQLENYIWIDPKIIDKNLEWLVQHQTPKGSFFEEGLAPNLHLYEMTLTSHVLIALVSAENLTTTVVARVEKAKSRAIVWINYNMQCVQNSTNTYELAVTTYALLLCKSSLAVQTLNSLRQLAKTSDDFIYWSNLNVSFPILMKSRTLDEHNSLSIETTAYALMVYVLNRDPKMHLIVNWLNANRMFGGVWSSRRATAVALAALIEFVKITPPRENTAIAVEIEAFSQAEKIQYIHINNSQSSIFQTIEADDFWRTININAKGVGYALLQFQIDVPVEEFVQSPASAYKLNNKVVLLGNYFSHISYTTCFRSLKTQQPSDIGLTVLDIAIPTGYGIQQQKLNAYVMNKQVKNLLRAKSLGSRVLFHFAALEPLTDVCVNYTIQRWYAVANTTTFLPIRVYDINAPESYCQIFYDTSPLNKLSICDVCGSSECSSCLNYSYAVRVNALNLLIILSFLSLVVFKNAREKICI